MVFHQRSLLLLACAGSEAALELSGGAAYLTQGADPHLFESCVNTGRL